MPPINLDFETEKPKRAVMTMTGAAAKKAKELAAAEGQDDLVLRVAVRPRGCSGLSYEMYFDTDVGEDDDVSETGGMQLVVDAVSAPHLAGATLDYRDALTGGGFTIENPSTTRTCGCGSSFR